MKLRLACGLLCCATFIAFGQDTPPQPPPQQPPPGAPGTPPTPKPTVQMPAPQPGQPAQGPPPERDTEGDDLSIMPLYWLTSSQPHLRKVHNATVAQPGALDFTGDRRYAYGGVLTIPTGHENSLQFTYFRKQSQGNSTLGADSIFFQNFFTNGDVLATHYNLQALKLSWNYLTYPFPSRGAKFRLKTLWEIQYVNMHSVFDAPADTNATTTEGRKSVILPTLGLGIEYHPAKHVVFEAKASGFGIPHHADIYDAEANLIVRAGHLELLAGGKIFHFKTSPQAADNYFYQTLYGPYAGLRYNFK